MSRHIAVLMGGPCHEHDVSLASGRMIAEALATRHRITEVVVGRDGRFLVAPDSVPRPAAEALTSLRSAGVDLAYLALHGPGGEDGTIQGLLGWCGIPHTGSGVVASVLAMNKDVFRALVAEIGVDVPPGFAFDGAAWSDRDDDLSGRVAAMAPCFVKAADQGSSFGVVSAATGEEARAAVDTAAPMSRRIVCERRVEGVELTCAVLEEEDGTPRALPLVEIVPRAGDFFDLASKYDDGGADEIAPARVAVDVAAEFQKIALEIHGRLGARGLSRTDAILADGKLWVLETNTLPGMTPASLFPKAAAAADISFVDLVDRIARNGLAAGPRRVGDDSATVFGGAP